jgi:hypothetical protein
MLKQAEITLTTLYLALSAALLAAVPFCIRGAMIRRGSRMSTWYQRGGMCCRAGKLALAASRLLPRLVPAHDRVARANLPDIARYWWAALGPYAAAR